MSATVLISVFSFIREFISGVNGGRNSFISFMLIVSLFINYILFDGFVKLNNENKTLTSKYELLNSRILSSSCEKELNIIKDYLNKCLSK